MIGGLYGMADASFGDPVAQARLLDREGVSPIQLRCKGWSIAEVRRVALELRDVEALIINDHASLAQALGRMVHLGADDGDARGPHGRSTHDIAQIDAAIGAAYVGFGPVFATATKETGLGPRGVEALAAAVRRSRVPVVAIGGIHPDNIEDVRRSGAAGWAVVGAIWGAADPVSVIRALR